MSVQITYLGKWSGGQWLKNIYFIILVGKCSTFEIPGFICHIIKTMNSTIILIIVACLIILYIIIKTFPKSSHTSNGFKPSDDNTSNSISSTEEIGTVNTFLHEQEINKNIYIVKQVFFKPGNTNEEAYSSEKVLIKGVVL